MFIFNPNEDENYEKVTDFFDLSELINHVTTKRVFRVRFWALDQLPELAIVVDAIGDCLLVIEEAHTAMPAGSNIIPELRTLLFQGRHRRVSLAIATPRPGALNINLRAVYTRIIAFNQSEPSDIKWIENATGTVIPDLSKFEIGDYYELTQTKQERKSLDDLKKLIRKD